MPKRKFDDDVFQPISRQKTEYTPETVLIKRKSINEESNQNKKQRMENHELDSIRRRNFELEQTVVALVNKVKTLEYMLNMFQRNETINSNNLVQAY